MSRRRNLPICLLGVGLMFSCCGGCSGRVPVDLVPVSGAVTLDGKPLSNATVQFLAQSDAGKKKGPVEDSQGMTDADGKYTLKGSNTSPGAVVGTHKVVVSKFVTKDGKDLVVLENEDPAIVKGTGRQLLSPQYSDILETTLTATVPEKGGTVNFDLKSKP